MPRFFTGQVNRERALIVGEDARHIALALRMKAGERLTVCDADGQDYQCVIERISPEQVELRVEEVAPSAGEPGVWITLYQALPKGDKLELIVQKAVELGVYEVIPMAAKRCVVKLDEKKAQAKINRWQGIVEAAAKQCRRGIIPVVREPMTMKEAVAYARELDVKLIPYELAEDMAHTKKRIEAIRPGESVAVFIGPEGGFEQEEIELATAAGIEPVTLGRRILRTETAGLTVLSWLMYHLES